MMNIRDKVNYSHLYSGNAWFIEDLYEAFLTNPANVSDEWRRYFLELGSHNPGATGDIAHEPVRQAFIEAGRQRSMASPVSTDVRPANHQKQVSVMQMINAYRFRGHRQADLDPLKQYDRPDVPELDPAYHGLTGEDLDRKFIPGTLQHQDAEITVREILDIVRTTYCRTIGAEYMHISEPEYKRWIQQRLEPCRASPDFDKGKKLRIMERLIAANAREEDRHTKYVGQKRFSLEGSETLIPVLDELVQDAGARQVKEVVIGMAHRGRLNVLVNILGKLPSELFSEFEGKGSANQNSSGDVKYHLGYSSDIETPGGPIHLTLSFNPSHLEIIDPVVEGSVRARQYRR